MRPTILLGAAALLLPAAARAQGTISAQGLGYPTGPYSTLARSTAGAVAEFDLASPVNPAAVANALGPMLFLHYAPEARTISVAGSSDEATLVRFPLIGGILPVTQRGAVSLTTATLLDRTWAVSRLTDPDGDGNGIRERFTSRGSINDVRLGLGWGFSRQLQVGLGGHVLVGNHQLQASRIDDDGGTAPFQQQTDVTYTGIAGSAGVIWNPSRLFSVGVSGVAGGTIRAEIADTTAAEATAPARASVGVRYGGIGGALLAARATWHGWSSLDDLGGSTLDARDAVEYSVGADVEGPSAFGAPLALRAGVRWSELPFAVQGEQPTEQAVAGGVGLLLSRGRVLIDFSAERARRDAASATETGWTFGAGVTVRP